MVKNTKYKNPNYHKEYYLNHKNKYIAYRLDKEQKYALFNKAYYAVRKSKMRPVVYRWRDVQGNIDYVGRGTLSRANCHKNKSTWWTPEHTMTYMFCRNEWHAMRVEGIWGELFRPKHNKDGYRFKIERV